LPNVREGLVSKYRLEKKEQLQANANKDYIKERETENNSFFYKSKMGKSENYCDKSTKSIAQNTIEEPTALLRKR
jgi:hypothetical protein